MTLLLLLCDPKCTMAASCLWRFPLTLCTIRSRCPTWLPPPDASRTAASCLWRCHRILLFTLLCSMMSLLSFLLQNGGKLSVEMSGPMHEVFAKVLRGLSGARITRPGHFKNAAGDGVSVRCSYKADDGQVRSVVAGQGARPPGCLPIYRAAAAGVAVVHAAPVCVRSEGAASFLERRCCCTVCHVARCWRLGYNVFILTIVCNGRQRKQLAPASSTTLLTAPHLDQPLSFVAPGCNASDLQRLTCIYLIRPCPPRPAAVPAGPRFLLRAQAAAAHPRQRH